MRLPVKYLIYRKLIDPLLASLHREVAKHAGSSGKVIDIASGPGSLSILLAGRAASVTAVDIDETMTGAAREMARRQGLKNIAFLNMDASDLSRFNDLEFDVAVTSMAVHQFNEELAVNILKEMKRISSKVIVADYNNPMPQILPRYFAWSIEWFAGGDHFRNYKIYMQRGGLEYFAGRAGLIAERNVTLGGGVFVIGILA